MEAPTYMMETARLDTLRSLKIIGAGPDPHLNLLVDRAREASSAEISSIALIDRDYQWHAALSGYRSNGVHRAIAFCNHVIQQPDTFDVPDAQRDVRFRFNPLVLCDPYIRSYRGFPITVDGFRIGSICIISPRSHAFVLAEPSLLPEIAEQAAQVLVRRRASMLH